MPVFVIFDRVLHFIVVKFFFSVRYELGRRSRVVDFPIHGCTIVSGVRIILAEQRIKLAFQSCCFRKVLAAIVCPFKTSGKGLALVIRFKIASERCIRRDKNPLPRPRDADEFALY